MLAADLASDAVAGGVAMAADATGQAAAYIYALWTRFAWTDVPELVRLSRSAIASAPWPRSATQVHSLAELWLNPGRTMD